VLVGEVWVGSGQSNMQGNAGGYAKGDPVLARLVAGSYPKIRLASARGGWREATPANTPGFSALLFSFGVRLHEKLDVPVGLILGAVGGTPSGPWLSEEAFKQDEALQALIKKLRANYHAEQAKKAFDESLAKWEKAAEQAKKDGTKPPMKPVGPIVPGEPRAKIGSLYETHIRPCVPFGIRGVLWDQGEGGTAVAGVDQYTLMGALIRGWRAEWNQGDFPFLFVQKPSGGGTAWDLTDDVTNQASKFEALPAKPPASTDGLDREVHIRIMKYPNTGIVTTTDLGAGIHPSNKSAYGTRAARVALGMVYGGKEEYYGPVYDSHKVEGNSIRLSFSHVGKGLTFKHGEKLQGFMIAGEDKAFQWGEATIEGNHVVVKSTQVSKPVAVRYAWGRTHAWANLFNQEGLPALTFRTDEW
jgi:sialate O-acetylesterase